MPDVVTMSKIKDIIALVAVAFSVFFFMEARHYLKSDAERDAVDKAERILMSESTRYAEIAKFYSDKMKEGEALTEAEKARLNLAERRQMEIHRTLTEKSQ